MSIFSVHFGIDCQLAFLKTLNNCNYLNTVDIFKPCTFMHDIFDTHTDAS